MQLKDIMNALGDRTDWIDFWCTYNIVDGEIVPVLVSDEKITLDSEVEICYRWYDHFNPSLNTKDVSRVIRSHDYNAFSKWYEEFKNEPWTYLPSDAFIVVNNEIVGTLCIAYDAGLFSLITFEEHECG